MAIKIKPYIPTEKWDVRWYPITKIKRSPLNPRINAHAVATVLKSLNEFGWRQPIVTDQNLEIIVGDTRYQAAMKRGDKKVPVHVAEDLSPLQVKAYRIADNRTGEEAEWDNKMLVTQIEELKEEQYDISNLGFSAEDLKNLEIKEDVRHLEDFDLTPKPKPIWIMISTDEQGASLIENAVKNLKLSKHTRFERTTHGEKT